jgi:hypothetical protein
MNEWMNERIKYKQSPSYQYSMRRVKKEKGDRSPVCKLKYT